jgi:hypothetical protein
LGLRRETARRRAPRQARRENGTVEQCPTRSARTWPHAAARAAPHQQQLRHVAGIVAGGQVQQTPASTVRRLDRKAVGKHARQLHAIICGDACNR